MKSSRSSGSKAVAASTSHRTTLLDWGLIDGHRFQELCADLLAQDSFQVLDQGIGPDGGIDLLAIQNVFFYDGLTRSYRWAIQSKYRSSPRATVSPRELGNIGNLLSRFQADGFLLITNGRVTAKAFAEIRSISEGPPPSYLSYVWDNRTLEGRILQRPTLIAKYFGKPNAKAVLVVEDNEAIKMCLTLVLSELGHAVYSAGSYEEAVRVAQGALIDVAVLDIVLHDRLTGLDVAAMLRDRNPLVKIIYHSAYFVSDLMARAVAEGSILAGKIDTSLDQLRDLVQRSLQAPPELSEKAAEARSLPVFISSSLHAAVNRLRAAQYLAEAGKADREVIVQLEQAVMSIRSLTKELAAEHGYASRTTELIPDVMDLVASVGHWFSRADSSARIKVEGPPQPIALKGNRNALESALSSLIENALEALPADMDVAPPLVRVSLLKRERVYATLEVCDKGPGIPADFRHRVLEFGFTTKGTGSGMGLSLAGKVAELHGGWLELESPAGAWSTVARLCLPAVTGA